MNLRKFIRFNLAALGNPPWETGITPPEVREHLANYPPGRALDLGCGTGTNVINICKHGWDAVGVDFIPVSIIKAKRKAHLSGVADKARFHLDTVTRLKAISGKFDLILDMGCYHNLTPRERRLYQEKINLHLQNDGIFMLYGMLGGEDSDHGIFNSDLDAFSGFLVLHKRQDGVDRNRNSLWLWFTRKSSC